MIKQGLNYSALTLYLRFMAHIFNSSTQSYVALAPHHTFGRLANSVDTHIDKPYISKLHAAIEWSGKEWRIKNLGLNGTWVNGVSLAANEFLPLNVNDRLHFAKQDDPGFVVIDLHPPADMLWPLDALKGTKPEPIYLTRYHLLPDSLTPELALYLDDQTQQWQMESMNSQQEHHTHSLNDGDLVQLGSQHWQLMRAQVVGPTEAHSFASQQLCDMEFIFNLSLDEESTQLELVNGQQKIDLAVRNHHYLLAQLARHRAADAEKGLDSKSRGWIYTEVLASELGLDTTHMNIYIFRLRKQIADSLPTILGQQILLERRGGKIRFGCEKFKIYKGETLTLSSP